MGLTDPSSVALNKADVIVLEESLTAVVAECQRMRRVAERSLSSFDKNRG
jgi:hypothetical protein